MKWVYAGSKHESRQFIVENLFTDAIRRIGENYSNIRPGDEVHLVGTVWHRKDFDRVINHCLATSATIIMEGTSIGIVTAPSLEIAHVYSEPLGISEERGSKVP